MQDIKLRDYQVEAINACVQDGLCILPQGSGKSVIIGELFKRNPDALIVVPRCKLREQNRKFGSKNCHTINMAYRRKLSANLLIIDEAHLVAEERGMYQQVIKRCNTVIGFTATPYRLDVGHIVPDIFPKILYEVKRDTLIDAGFLVKRKYEEIDPDLLITVKSFITLHMSKEACPQSAKSLQDFISRDPGKSIIFTCDIGHCEKVKAILGDKGVTIHSNLSYLEIERAYDAFRSGAAQFLINCEMLTLGFDEPDIESVCLLRPTDSYTLYEQMIGRGDRIAVGKTLNRIFDYTANSFNFKVVKKGDGKQYCLHCGEYVDYRKSKCSACGKALIKGAAPTKHCKKCHEANHTKASYCNNCGSFMRICVHKIESDSIKVKIVGTTAIVDVDGTSFLMRKPEAEEFYSLLRKSNSKRTRNWKGEYKCINLMPFSIYYKEVRDVNRIVKIEA